MIRTNLIYGCETCILNSKIANTFDIFERKMLQRNLGPVNNVHGWKIRYNFELYKMYKESQLTQYIRLQRLRWAGHVATMGENRIPRKLLYTRIHGKRPMGRPRRGWEDAVDELSLIHI